MVFIISPFREGSTRFPDKFLADIDGEPMWYRVYENLVDCPWSDGMVVTFPRSDLKIAQSVDEHKVPFIYTYMDPDYVCGTDRVYDAAFRLGIKRGIVINAQADEPLITHRHVRDILTMFDDIPAAMCVTLVYRADDGDEDDVGVMFDGTKQIFDFRRQNGGVYYKNIGIHGFRFEALAEFYRLGPSPRELDEKIELLRFIEAKIPVHCTLSAPTVAVDRPHHLDLVRGYNEF